MALRTINLRDDVWPLCGGRGRSLLEGRRLSEQDMPTNGDWRAAAGRCVGELLAANDPEAHELAGLIMRRLRPEEDAEPEDSVADLPAPDEPEGTYSGLPVKESLDNWLRRLRAMPSSRFKSEQRPSRKPARQLTEARRPRQLPTDFDEYLTALRN